MLKKDIITSLSQEAALFVGKMLAILGCISYGIAVIGFISCASQGITPEDIGMILLFAVIGFALRKAAKKIKTDIENARQYLAIIENSNIHQLDDIATATGRSYNTVKSDIQKMLQKGYLKNAYINENTRQIVLPDCVANTGGNDTIPPIPAIPRIVVCSCCGASNRINGDSGECEYCGSVIS